MARYRKVELRMWADEKFRSLTPPPPNARDIWIALLIGECTTQIPGVIIATPARLADSLGWGALDKREAFERAFGEVLTKMPVQADIHAGLLWLPNAPRYNRPQSPNVITGWHDTWQLVPECKLKNTIASDLIKTAHEMHWSHAHLESLSGLISVECPIQEQEQEQEQDINTLPLAFGQGVKAPPLPFTVEQALEALQESSDGRFRATNPGRSAIHIQRLIRKHPDLKIWRTAGAWLGAGGESYKSLLDSRSLTDANFEAWVAYSQDWEASGRPQIEKRQAQRDTRLAVRTDR